MKEREPFYQIRFTRNLGNELKVILPHPDFPFQSQKADLLFWSKEDSRLVKGIIYKV